MSPFAAISSFALRCSAEVDDETKVALSPLTLHWALDLTCIEQFLRPDSALFAVILNVENFTRRVIRQHYSEIGTVVDLLSFLPFVSMITRS